MSSKSKSKQEEALQLLDELDALSPSNVPAAPSPGRASTDSARQTGVPPPSTGSSGAPNEDAADVLQFIDEITQKSSEPTRAASRAGTPAPGGSLRKTTERIRVGSPAPSLHARDNTSGSAAVPARRATPDAAQAQAQSQSQNQKGGGWGWGSVWSSASAALQQAKSAVEENVKALPNNEQAKKWSEGMMGYVPVNREQLEKFGNEFKTRGFTTLNEILNVVAPPISEHEVIQVWLSHDMEGYDGVESVVYRALARIMEQVEGGDLVVNKGHESKPREPSVKGQRNMNAVDGLETAIKLAEANIQELIKSKAKQSSEPAPTPQNPTHHSYVYLRIQPFHYSLPTTSTASSAPVSPDKSNIQQLQFVLHLSDPEHQLTHTSVTQAIPAQWESLLDKHEWIEDLIVDALRVGVEVIGQEYVVARMGWIKEEGEAEKVQEQKPQEEAK